MSDKQKMRRIYAESRTVRVMGVVAAIGVGLAVRRADLAALGMFAFGWTVYVVEEHLVHRFIFHAPAPRRQFLFDLLYRLHYGHHDQITNKDLLFTPLWFAIALTLANIAVLSFVLPLDLLLIGALGGGVTAYLLFEWLHLVSHFTTTQKGRLGFYIARRHGKHHHIDYGNWYTVSPGGQLVDKALRSDPAVFTVVSNVRTCGLDPGDPRLTKSRIRFGSDETLANGARVGRIEAPQAG